ncbi:transcriptional regulator [Nocardioides rubriscoriae]|uniref:transcriptional regulator n=1 Tax=Nocardioides rubriscoriae TaxID=642762 RepID=UPI0011DF72F1|nr:transcriptional regulator [Nocardioides rubriscoriae]
MTPRSRWSVVAGVVLAVVAVPLAPRLLPVGDTDVTAAVLLDAVRGSADVGHSGYVETRGAVQLPVGDDLGDVGELLAGTTRLRVWWQDEDAWRVDRLLVAGEKDLVHDGPVTVAYDYEDAKAVVTEDPAIRLPRASDLLPPVLGRAVLEDAADTDVRRLGPRRVAGVDAPGLRYTPPAGRSTVDHVDVWVEPGSGLPLRVEVWDAGADDPAGPDVVSTFDDVEVARPADDRVGFPASRGVEVERADTLDVADAAGRYAPFVLPRRLAGFARRTEGEVAAATFGSGVSRFLAVPLRSREADPLRRQLRAAPGVVTGDYRTVARSGVLTVLLTGADRDPGAAWLVAGTLSPDTLEDVARALLVLPYVDQR